MERDKELVQKISLLKGIEPRQNWVLFAKRQILTQGKEVGQEGLFAGVGHILFNYLERATFALRATAAKPAYVFAALAFVVLGGVGYQISQNSLPGDALYSVRSALERATTGSDPLASLQVAQRRLADLKKVVSENRVRNLSSATQEFTQSVAAASRDLLALVENEPSKALQASKELVQLQKGKAQIEQLLGAVIGTDELLGLESATRTLVEAELEDLATRTLTADQEALLSEAQAAYESGDYEKALENIWSISN